MAVRPSDFVQDFRRYRALTSKAHQGYLVGLEALYRMCREHPGHSDPDATVSKLWLIGRSFAAALERAHGGQEDVYRKAARRLGRTVDRHLQRLRAGSGEYTAAELQDISRAVDWLSRAFQQVTGDRKVSLASKYLHFHAPRVVIFDSISEARLRGYFPRSAVAPEFLRVWRAGRYGRHLSRVATALGELHAAGEVDATARDVDVFLILCPDRD